MLRNVTFAMIIAVLTAGATLTVLYPTPLTAGDEPAVVDENPFPALEVDGCSVTLNVVDESVKPGDPVQLSLKAHNPTAEPVQLTVNASLYYESPADMMSRRMAPMMPIWTQPCSLLVPPGETVEAAYTTEQPAGGGGTLSTVLQVGDQTVYGKPVSVPAPEIDITVEPEPEIDVVVEPATETSAPSE